MKTYLVTGGAGFIGSNYVHYLFEKYNDIKVINLDKLTYAGNLDNLKVLENNPDYRFVKGDICDEKLVDELVQESDIIVNFAAESHVDRSIGAPDAFIQTDIFGAFVLLESANKHGIEKFILSGLCGGAITGLLTSEHDTRVEALLGLGMPVVFDVSEEQRHKYFRSNKFAQ